jgi:apolipoprotein N-acyltransferase
MSYRGALTLTHDVVISACYAVGVGGVIYLLAMLNITIIPALSHHNRRGLAWLAYALSILIAVLISSYTNLAGIAGDSVITLDARHHVESVQKIISQTSLSAQTAQSTATSLRAEQTRFLKLAKAEKNSGCVIT